MPTYNAVSTGTLIGSYDDSSDTSTPSEVISVSSRTTITNGTGASQADLFYSTRAQHTGTASYDLTASLVDRFGNTLTYVEVTEIWLINRSTTAADLLVMQGNLMSAFLNGTTPTADVGPDGEFHMTNPIDGFTVTGTSQDVLTVDAGGNTISYDLFIIGRSA